jgi:hypothetical protein
MIEGSALTADVRFPELLASSVPPDARTSVSAAPPETATVSQLPRYYLGSYYNVDDKGNPHPLTDQVQIDDYLQKLKKWIPADRILASDPHNCDDRNLNPCEEIDLREESSGNTVILVTEIKPKVFFPPSTISHTPFRNQTVKKNTWLDTRSCLSNVASYSLSTHDKLHHQWQ